MIRNLWNLKTKSLGIAKHSIEKKWDLFFHNILPCRPDLKHLTLLMVNLFRFVTGLQFGKWRYDQHSETVKRGNSLAKTEK